MTELVKLCESFSLPVTIAISNLYLNFPADHPLHLGFDPMKYVPHADLILVIESDVPWFPTRAKPNPEAKIIQIGIDPFFSRYPMRTFPVDMPISPTLWRPDRPEGGLIALSEENRKEITDSFTRLAGEHAEQRKTWRAAAEKLEKERPIDMEWLSYCIGKVRDGDTVLINEYDLRTHQVALNEPGTFFGSPMSSGLGWSFGAALG